MKDLFPYPPKTSLRLPYIRPIQLLPLEDTHEVCSSYLLKLDYVCADMLESIRELMPVEIDGRAYTAS